MISRIRLAAQQQWPSRPRTQHLAIIVVVLACAILLAACGSEEEPPPEPPADGLPTADAGGDGEAASGQTVTLNGGGSRDPENATLTFSWTQQAGQTQVTLRGANTAQATFAAPTVAENTSLTFTLTVTDPAGQADTDTVQITISPPPPAAVTDVRITSEPEVNDTYDVGETIIVEVVFSGAVTLVGGNPSLTLDIGTGTGAARYSAGGGTNTLTFRYGVRPGDADDDGIGIKVDALQTGLGSIRDTSGQTANTDLGSHAIAGDANHKVEANPLGVSGVRIVPGMQGQAGAHGAAETIMIEVTFSEAVTVTGEPTLAIMVGAHTRQAAYAVGSGTNTLTFHYDVQDGDHDGDGISIGADALQLNGGSIHNAHGYAVATDLGGHAIANDANHRVLANPVHVTDVQIVPRARSQGDTYAVADTIAVLVTFSGPVTVTGDPTLAIKVGVHTRQASYITGSGTRTLTFQYDVRDDDSDTDGIGIEADALQLHGGSLHDADGLAADADLGSHVIEGDANHKVDGSVRRPLDPNAPTSRVRGVRITSQARGQNTYGAMEAIVVNVSFSSTVIVSGNPAPVLVIGIGSQDRLAGYEGGSGTSTLTFRYVVAHDDRDVDGIDIAADALQLNGGNIIGANGRTADGDLDSHTIAGDANHKVDGGAGQSASSPDVPTSRVQKVRIASRAQSLRTYGATETIVVNVTFSSSVTVTGKPVLTIDIGLLGREAVYQGGSGTATLIFEYVMQAGDADADGITVATNALSLNGGSITGFGGRAANLNLGANAIANDASHKVDGSVDRLATVTNLSILSRPRFGDTYVLGDTIAVQVIFSEAIEITGSNGPNLRFDIGSKSPSVGHESAGGQWLRFDYAVRQGDIDANGISIAADALQAGNARITDLGGQAVNLDLSGFAISDDSHHKVDTSYDTPPTADAGDDPARPVRAGTIVTLDGTGSSDAQTSKADLIYAWEPLCGPEVTLAGADTARPTFTARAVLLDQTASNNIPPLPEPDEVSPFEVYTTATFRLTVTDERNNQDTDTVTVTVAPANAPATPPSIAAPDRFENRCAIPRSSDDMQGTTEDEKNWVRAWNHEQYLWYREIIDHDPAGPHDTQTYFDLMKTFAEVSSCGKPRDEFHFSEPDLGDAGASGGTGVSEDSAVQTDEREIGFGAIFATFNNARLFVMHVHPASPMGEARLANANGRVVATGLRRGDEITRIDDIAVNAITLRPGPDRQFIANSILASGVGITRTFVVVRSGIAGSMTATITTNAHEVDPVPRYDVIDTDTGRVGYLLFVNHVESAEAKLIDAMALFEERDITDLVLDLRYNQGGLLDIAANLASMVANPAATDGRIYERLIYNDKHVIDDENDIQYFGAIRKHSEPKGDTDLPNLGLNRLFVITTRHTCSASESIINGLIGVDIEVIQIGEATCGKPYGTVPTPNCGRRYFSTQFIGVNAKGFGDYQYGFAPGDASSSEGGPVRLPGCFAQDIDYGHPLGDAQGSMLAKALTYRSTNGSCTATDDPGTTPSSHSVGPGVDFETIMHTRPVSTGRIVER